MNVGQSCSERAIEHFTLQGSVDTLCSLRLFKSVYFLVGFNFVLNCLLHLLPSFISWSLLPVLYWVAVICSALTRFFPIPLNFFLFYIFHSSECFYGVFFHFFQSYFSASLKGLLLSLSSPWHHLSFTLSSTSFSIKTISLVCVSNSGQFSIVFSLITVLIRIYDLMLALIGRAWKAAHVFDALRKGVIHPEFSSPSCKECWVLEWVSQCNAQVGWKAPQLFSECASSVQRVLFCDSMISFFSVGGACILHTCMHTSSLALTVTFIPTFGSERLSVSISRRTSLHWNSSSLCFLVLQWSVACIYFYYTSIFLNS